MRNSGLKITMYAVTFVLATLWGGAQAAGNLGSVSVFYGQKYLNQNDWEPNESQSETGLGVMFQQPDWPVAVVGNYFRSSDSAIDSINFDPPVKTNAETTEISAGARKDLTEGAIKVFVDGGLVSISAKIKGVDTVTGESLTVSDSAAGLWLGGGMDVMLGSAVSFGGIVRMSKADKNGSALGGTHFGIYAAYHFQQ